MDSRQRAMWFLVLCFFVGGCASAEFRPVSLGHSDSGGAPGEAETPPTVEVGSTVRVTMRSGVVVSGVVAEVTAEELVVQQSVEYGGSRVSVATRDIDNIRMQYADTNERVLFFIVVGGLVAGLYLLANAIGSMAGN